MDYTYYLLPILAFLAVVLFLEGIFLAWNAYKGPEARRLEQRLQAMTAGHGTQEMSILKHRLLSKQPALHRLLLEIPRIHQLDRLLQQSGLTLNVARFLGMTLLAPLLVGLVLWLVLELPILVVLAGGAVAAAAPLVYVLSAKNKRLQTIEQQLPDALDLMARALRAGHAFPSALKMVGEEMAEPIGGEFRIAFDELNYGVSLQDAMTNLATRVPSTDLRYFVISVLIQRETGGNLAELLDNISALIRARLKLMGAIRVLSAEGRLSAWILTLLPFILAGVIAVISPRFIAVLWLDPLGQKMIGGALAMMIFGIWAMWRIIKIRV